jgi:hypothetical protein
MVVVESEVGVEELLELVLPQLARSVLAKRVIKSLVIHFDCSSDLLIIE